MKGMFLEACTKRQHKDRIVNTGHLIVHPTKTQALLIHGSVGFHFNRIIRCKLGNGHKKKVRSPGLFRTRRDDFKSPSTDLSYFKRCKCSDLCLPRKHGFPEAGLEDQWVKVRNRWVDTGGRSWHHTTMPCLLNNRLRAAFFLLHLAAHQRRLRKHQVLFHSDVQNMD